MGRYESVHTTSWWERVKLLEPAMLRAILAAIVGALLVWGVDLTPWADKIGDSWALIFPLIALLQGWWTRTVVSPSAANGLQ